MSKEAKVLLGIAVVVIGLGVIFAVLSRPQETSQNNKVDANILVNDSSHMIGNKDAKVTLVEFGDFQCPACGIAEPEVEKLLANHNGDNDFRFVFRNFPLSSIHANAEIAAEAAEAAGAQNKFWEMHNKLYATQNEWASNKNPGSLFLSYAQNLGLNTEQFKSDLENHKYANTVQSDYADGEKANVQGTPTFFINNTEYTGRFTASELEKAIQKGKK